MEQRNVVTGAYSTTNIESVKNCRQKKNLLGSHHKQTNKQVNIQSNSCKTRRTVIAENTTKPLD